MRSTLSTPTRLRFLIAVLAVMYAPHALSQQSTLASGPLGGATSPGGRDSILQALTPVGPPRLMSAQKVIGINSPDRDNTPIVSADGMVMFFNSTRRGDRSWARYNQHSKRYDEDIYFAVRSSVRRDAEYWDEPVNIGSTLNSSEDDGVVSISPDGQTLYFNSLKKGWERDGGPFYLAKLRGRDWCDITPMGGGIADFFAKHPRGAGFRIYGGSISSDGNTFYFATTLYSPTGKHQIWVSRRTEHGWGYPENLGPTINDGFGSYAPCIAADGVSLFYASSAPRGNGGDDIYLAKRRDSVWSDPVNIGSPINTSEDNSFLSLPASGDRVYFSITSDGNEDIFVAPLPHLMRPHPVVLVSGRVTDRISGKPLEAKVTIEDLSTGKTIFEANSNQLDGLYTAVLPAGRDYGISISAPGYLFLSERYTIAEETPYNEYRQDFPLEQLEQLKTGGSFVVNNIFFDYNEATLSATSKPELERVIALMQERPTLSLEIHGHTDNVGSASYNVKLSLRRAEAVRDYLVTTGGISADRLRVRGFGFTKPVATNKTEEGRHQNRRSEFTVITM